MPANVHTQLLGKVRSLAPGTNDLGPPDIGYRWVVTDVTAMNINVGNDYLNGFFIADEDEVCWFGARWPYAQVGFPYHWSGRQVVDEPSGLVHIGWDDPNWHIRVTGYVLTLP